MTVSEQEVLEDFQKRNTKFDLSYVPVSVADLAQAIKPTDAEMQEFFQPKQSQLLHFRAAEKDSLRFSEHLETRRKDVDSRSGFESRIR